MLLYFLHPENVYVFCAIPAVALVMAFWYPLNKKLVNENNQELKQRRNKPADML